MFLDSLAKDSSVCDDELTESQQKDVDEWVELLINNENSDTPSSTDEKEQSEEFDKTWFPSSGFCVRKDMHEIGVQNHSTFKYHMIIIIIITVSRPWLH